MPQRLRGGGGDRAGEEIAEVPVGLDAQPTGNLCSNKIRKGITVENLSRRSFVKSAAAMTAAGAIASTASVAMADNMAAALPEKWDYEADVVIVGYGAAGAIAAREAMAQGASALVLEKCDEFYCGGSTSASAGAVFPNNVDDMYVWSRGYITREAIEEVVNEGLKVATWLDANGLDRTNGGKGVYATTKQIVDGCGVKVLYETPAKRLVADPATHEVFGVIAEDTNGGKGVYATTKQIVDGCGVKVLYETPAKRLVADPATHEVFGVIAEDASGNPVAVKANKGVLLASGGFLGNEELVHRFVVPREIGLVNYGAPTCTGDGLLMAMSVGAGLKNLTSMCLELYGKASVAFTKASQEIGTGLLHTPDGEFNGARIIVNQQAKRFMDEDKEYIHTKCNYEPFNYAGGWMAYQGYSNLPMYLIFDSQLMNCGRLCEVALSPIGWAYAKDVYTWSDDNRAELEKGWFVEADTIEELVQKLAEQSGNEPLDAATLQQTIDTYNGYCADGYDPDCHRLEYPNMFVGEPSMQPLGEPPYYAAQISPCALYTIGGLHWGEGGATLDWDGNPIPGLYHAGDVGQYSEISTPRSRLWASRTAWAWVPSPAAPSAPSLPARSRARPPRWSRPPRPTRSPQPPSPSLRALSGVRERPIQGTSGRSRCRHVNSRKGKHR